MIANPFNFQKWIEDHREVLKPPVGNKCVYEDSDFIIMVVGGPNNRKDYHVNEGEEFFYQLEGNINLKIKDGTSFRDIPIKQGDIFLLPPNVPHSPQRPADSIGLVIERKRADSEKDGFQWYCDKCQHLLYEEFFHLTNIETQLPQVFDRFYNNTDHTTCSHCGHQNHR